jgi:hypothetical protein
MNQCKPTTNPNNKPDIIIRDNKKGVRMLIHIAIPRDRNVIKQEAEKILKYKNLITEIQCVWNVKAKVKPVIIGVTGTISQSLRHYLSNIPENHNIKELQKKNSHTGHCTHTADSADVKVQNI